MEKRKLIRQGDSIAVVIPAKALTRLRWFMGDHVTCDIRGDELVLRNIRSHSVTPLHHIRDYGMPKPN